MCTVDEAGQNPTRIDQRDMPHDSRRAAAALPAFEVAGRGVGGRNMRPRYYNGRAVRWPEHQRDRGPSQSPPERCHTGHLRCCSGSSAPRAGSFSPARPRERWIAVATRCTGREFCRSRQPSPLRCCDELACRAPAASQAALVPTGEDDLPQGGTMIRGALSG